MCSCIDKWDNEMIGVLRGEIRLDRATDFSTTPNQSWIWVSRINDCTALCCSGGVKSVLPGNLFSSSFLISDDSGLHCHNLECV